MKVILRCALAALALVGCFLVVSKSHVQAQSCCTNSYCNPPTPACPNPECDYFGGCDWQWECDSPILIDVANQGFHLTSQANGVMFQFFGSTKQQVAWTDPNYSNAWLALDRNGNGTIDNASELFGNDTPQPSSPNQNGFAALAVYDLPANGGNGDGFITAADSIYPHLLLWTDLNHNGISEPSELEGLAQAGITSISLQYHLSQRTDRYGNSFRYKGRVTISSVDYDKNIYDVFLVGIN